MARILIFDGAAELDNWVERECLAAARRTRGCCTALGSKV
jgi:hypothetical protein